MPKLISISSLLSKSWSLYRSRFSYFVSLLAVPYGIFVLNSLVAQFIFSTPLVLVLSSVSLILLVLATIAILLSLESNELPDFKQSWQLAWPHFWPLVLVSLVTGFVVVGGMFLFLIPGLIFIFYLSFAKVVVILEKKKSFSALVQSWFYVRGYLGSVVVRILIIVVATILVLLVMSFISEIFGQFISYLMMIASFFIVMPFLIIYYYCLYKDLREIKGVEVGGSVSRNSVKLASWFGLAGWVVTFVSAWLFLALINSSWGDGLANLILVSSLGN